MKGLIGSEMKQRPNINAEVLTKALYGVKAILYKDGMIEQVAELIAQGKDAASVISDVVSMMAGEVKKKYADIDSQTLFVFGVYATAEIVRTLKQAGLVSDSKKVTEDSIKGVVMKFIENNPESIDVNAYQKTQVNDSQIKDGKRLMLGV